MSPITSDEEEEEPQPSTQTPEVTQLESFITTIA